MSDLDDIVRDFLVEVREMLDGLGDDLLRLEANPDDVEIITAVFRTVHNIKGTCGFLGLSQLESITHVGENLLCALRDGETTASQEVVTALLALIDAVERIVACLEETGGEGDADHGALIGILEQLCPDRPETPTLEDDRVGQILVSEGQATDQMIDSALEAQVASGKQLGKVLVQEHELDPLAVAEALTTQTDARSGARQDTTIRVDVDQLDSLMNLVGELVLARNQIVQFSSFAAEPTFAAASQRLDLITTELQEGVMQTRMQPIGTVWNRFPRLVRDLCLQCGKQVGLDMVGTETELDKTLLEAIRDPLTHAIRNCVDHGIEMPEDREAAGKSPVGALVLRAYHEGGQVIVEICDDGGGIDPIRVRDKAIARGILTADRARQMSDRDLVDLVFAPGFSTAAAVTNVSGRGVGMDVVRTNIERIGGTVDLQSAVGVGTTLTVKIPLTLAIIPALMVTSGHHRLAIPQVSLLELVRLEEPDHHRIEHVQGTPVYRLRGKLLPLVRLADVLGVDADEGWGASGPINIVVLQAEDRQFGIVVDSVMDTQEIVVKPLSRHLKHLDCYAGATILGDGRIALIVDVTGLARHTGVLNENRRLSTLGGEADDGDADAIEPLLLLGDGHGGRVAVPLSMVARLECFPPERIERSAGQDVVQYRGEILPLIRVADPPPDSDELHVVVYSTPGGHIGLVVHSIVDIVQERPTVRRDTPGNGTLGSVVVQDRVTDLLDVRRLIASADPTLLAAAS